MILIIYMHSNQSVIDKELCWHVCKPREAKGGLSNNFISKDAVSILDMQDTIQNILLLQKFGLCMYDMIILMVCLRYE